MLKKTLNKNADFLTRINANINEVNKTTQALLHNMENFIESLSKKLELSTSNPDISSQYQIENHSDTQSIQLEVNNLGHIVDALTDNDNGPIVHGNSQNPILNIPILECPVDYEKNRTIGSEVNFEPDKSIISKIETRKVSTPKFNQNNLFRQ